jgi:hypothetical protein
MEECKTQRHKWYMICNVKSAGSDRLTLRLGDTLDHQFWILPSKVWIEVSRIDQCRSAFLTY